MDTVARLTRRGGRHGRDNKLHVWQRIEELPAAARIGGSAALPSLPVPELCYSMDVNALNFCRFGLLPLSPPNDSALEAGGEHTALLALPSLVDSSTVRGALRAHHHV